MSVSVQSNAYILWSADRLVLTLTIIVQSNSYFRQSVYKAILTFVSQCTEQFLLLSVSVQSNSYILWSVDRLALTLISHCTERFLLLSVSVQSSSYFCLFVCLRTCCSRTFHAFKDPCFDAVEIKFKKTTTSHHVNDKIQGQYVLKHI